MIIVEDQVKSNTYIFTTGVCADLFDGGGINDFLSHLASFVVAGTGGGRGLLSGLTDENVVQ